MMYIRIHELNEKPKNGNVNVDITVIQYINDVKVTL